MKKAVIIIVSILFSIGVGVGSGLAVYNLVDHEEEPEPVSTETKNKIHFQGKFFEDYIAGEYKYIETYDEYKEIFGDVFEDSKEVLNKKDFENDSYIIIKLYYDACNEDNVQVKKYSIDGGTVNVEVKYDNVCYQCIEMDNYDYYLLRVEKDFKFDKVEFEYDVKEDNKCFSNYGEDKKPMIYIYPEKEMNVSIKLGYSEKLIVSYPKYVNSWNVLASPNGNLKYNGRNYYGLYWEGKNKKVQVREDGFVVKGEDIAKFLEDKLEILGLNEREINEFIVYWLPKMEHNKYNYVRFETREEIDNYMPLEVSPKPDTIIRVQMDFKALDNPITVKEQELTKVKRTGYTVVEWGGTEIN